MKFFLIAAFISVVAADSYSTNSYQAPQQTYSAPAYSSQSYSKNEYAASPYKFAWEVKDDYTYNDFSHQESGDGYGKASGSYRVVLPDGRIQTVTYKDDGYGYVADVKYEGVAKYPEYNPSYKADYKPAYSAPAYKPTYSAPTYRPATPVPVSYSAPAPYTTPASYTPEETYTTTASYQAPAEY